MPLPLVNDTVINEVSGIFGALADPSRLRILRALLEQRRPLNQSAIVEATGLSQANTSKHLACLARMGLVSRHQEGNSVIYALVEPLVSDLCTMVGNHAALRAENTFQALN